MVKVLQDLGEAMGSPEWEEVGPVRSVFPGEETGRGKGCGLDPHCVETWSHHTAATADSGLGLGG